MFFLLSKLNAEQLIKHHIHNKVITTNVLNYLTSLYIK